jgi:hypothetical protein
MKHAAAALVFRHPMHLISNMACCGTDEPADDSKPPEFMRVDYMRVSKNSAALELQ